MSLSDMHVHMVLCVVLDVIFDWFRLPSLYIVALFKLNYRSRQHHKLHARPLLACSFTLAPPDFYSLGCIIAEHK